MTGNSCIYGRSVIDKENFSIRLLEFFLSIPIFSDTIFQLDFCKIYLFLIFFFLFWGENVTLLRAYYHFRPGLLHLPTKYFISHGR